MKFSLLLGICLLALFPAGFAQKQELIDSLLLDVQRLNKDRAASGIGDSTLRDTPIIQNLVQLAIYNHSVPRKP